MPLTIHLHPSERQTAFNLERWRELLADRDLARLPHRIETDRHGHILMSLPPAPAHGDQQSEIVSDIVGSNEMSTGEITSGQATSVDRGLAKILSSQRLIWHSP